LIGFFPVTSSDRATAHQTSSAIANLAYFIVRTLN
jgi:hypothetical protein